ncbi:flavoprotein [Lentzea tibetensis]|uniref:Flavoprotein n=1 Tax=Lentzea tibetensis TaxID=2591470 RepID=A0A563EIT2_9PSEU|nr:flavoprotein [Lentzea tibetensis]TWP46728.1 flavoprotein [Lentzea tibetensis]
MILGLVASAGGGVEQWFRTGLVEPAIQRGWQPAITFTPTVARWFEPELAALQALTDLPVRWLPRLPSEPKPYPMPDAFIFAPATANSIAKLALGIADNQALTALGEALGTVPMVIRPQANDAQRGHPAWAGHVETLRRAGAVIAEPESPERLIDYLEAAVAR